MESERKAFSISSLVNQILKDYVEWGIFQPKVGMIPVLKPLLTEMFAKTPKAEIVDMAKRLAKDAMKDISLFMTGKRDLDSFLSWLELRMRKCGAYTYQTTENLDNDKDINSSNNGDYFLVVKHDLGENWSLYNKTVLDLIFNEVYEKRVYIETSPTIISIKLKR
jgi:hypothetical protein